MKTTKDNAFLLGAEPVKKARDVWYNSVLDANLPEVAAIPDGIREMIVDQSWNDGFLQAVEWIYSTMFSPDTKGKKDALLAELVEIFGQEKGPWPRTEMLLELADKIPTPLLIESVRRIKAGWMGGAPCPPQ